MKNLLALMFFAMISVSPSSAVSAEGYTEPDPSMAALVFEEKQFVADRTPPTAIDIRTYRAEDGSTFRAYSVGGDVFRYDVDTDGRPPYEYRILDNDGDGVFETKEQLVGEITVQDKGQKYFIDLGPEPGKEYRYSYEETHRPGLPEQRQMLMGYPIYIPAWVITRFR